MAFDGVLPAESASYAGQAGISRPLAYQSNPERLLHRFPSLGVTPVPSDRCPSFRRGGDIEGGHELDAHNTCFSEGGVLAVVVSGIPESVHQTRDDTDFPRRLRNSEARLRLAGPPPVRRNGAPYERGAGGESDPRIWAAGAARGRAKGDRGRDTLCPPCGEVALTTVIPTGRAK